ncbi:MAG TPA: SgcJ/EcaC family oxidoreductase [Pyrinomonadaceae bacterium]|nr:SgcJ/EcaC family oxidoreductase [Pyrinomonadaceae bacterium]
MRRIILPILILFAACSLGQAGSLRGAPSTTEADSKIVAAVRAVLEAQSDAWNRGDIEGFLDGYARSPDIVFVSGDKVMRGWQTVLDYYKQSYNSREKMGKLTFSELEITPLGSDAAIVLGRWHLKRVEDEPRGRFTLLLRRTEQGWKVVHDHTSSA